jgi:uncharacterized protein (TIGR02246 family)
MRTAFAAVFMLALTLPGFAQTPAGGAGDEAAIRKVIQQQDDARNTSNWKALSALFTDDADQLTSAGEWRNGRAEIEKGIAQTMTGTYKGAKYATTIDRVRMVAPNVAIADGAFEIQNIAGGGSRRGQSANLMVKSGGRWRIAASRSMVKTSVGATPAKQE